MLNRKDRLPAYLIPQVLQKGRRFKGRFFSLFVVDQQPKTKFAVIVSLKIDKRAVKRNKIKRQLYTIIRLNLNRIKAGQHVVFLVKKTIIGEKFASIKAETERVWQKAGLF